jgi:hypothetical protein
VGGAARLRMIPPRFMPQRIPTPYFNLSIPRDLNPLNLKVATSYERILSTKGFNCD